MVLTAHQTAAYAWLGLLHKIALADTFCLFDCVQMSNDDWERRQYIKTANGTVLLTVPLQSKGYRDKKLFELEIDNSQNWRKKHWDTIRFSYKKAKFFPEYEPFFNDFFKRDWQYLTQFNEHFLLWVLSVLKIDVEYCRASDLHFEGTKSDLVLDMCKKLNADMYIFGEQGVNYADRESFEQAGIKLYFQKYNHPIYPQLWGEFKPYMSVIDLLMNTGPATKGIIMSDNITKGELRQWQ